MPSKIAERVNGFSKRVTDVLPSMSGGFLTNKWMLYLVLFSAIFDILFFYKKNDMHAILIFLVIGFLVSFFSKNMVVILILAIVLTHLIRFGKQATEGFEDEEDEEGFEGEEEDEEGFEGEEEEEEGFEGEEEDEEGFEGEEEEEEGFEGEEEEDEMFANRGNQEHMEGVGELIQTNKELMSEMKKIEPLLTKAEGYLSKKTHEGFGDFNTVYATAAATKKPESFIDIYEKFAAHKPMPMHMARFGNDMNTRAIPR